MSNVEFVALRYGPEAPPIAEQLGFDPAEEACQTAQMVLDGIVAARAEDRMPAGRARRMRQEITESLIRRMEPSTIIEGREHLDRHGRKIG